MSNGIVVTSTVLPLMPLTISGAIFKYDKNVFTYKKYRWINKFYFIGSKLFGNLIGFKSGCLL